MDKCVLHHIHEVVKDVFVQSDSAVHTYQQFSKQLQDHLHGKPFERGAFQGDRNDSNIEPQMTPQNQTNHANQDCPL